MSLARSCGPSASLALIAASIACQPHRPTEHTTPSASAPIPSASATAPVVSATASATSTANAPDGGRHVAPTSCATPFKGKPETWRARALGASEKDRDAVLAEAGLTWPKPLSNPEDDKPFPPWTLAKASVMKLPLAHATAEDFWVELHFTEPGGGPPSRAFRSAALVKEADGTYCALPGPADAQAFVDHTCLGSSDVWPIEILFAHVLDKDRLTVVERSTAGHCDGCARAAEEWVTLLDVRSFEIAPVFRQSTFEAYYSGCPWPPSEWTHASVEWIGPYPRDVHVVSEIECQPHEGRNPKGTSECTPSAGETRWRFVGDHYEPEPSRAIDPAKAPPPVPLEEAGFDDGSGRAWAGRCFRQLGDGKLDDADLSCKRALLHATDVEIRGSTYYNLALVAEKRGDAKAACAALHESLATRPANATTKEKQRTLCP